MKFEEIVMECFDNKEFVSEYNRITGSSIRQQKLSIYQLIDQVTGKEEEELKKFISFVDEYVYQPVFDKNIEG